MGTLHEKVGERAAERSWPSWARRVVSAVLLFHLAALLAGVLGAVPPHSIAERETYEAFKPYYDLTDQGWSYHYYSPEPPPTPVVEATLHFADGRPDRTVRLPERGAWPRLRYQRQLALAHHLYMDFDAARRIGGDGSKSRWAQSYARHLGHVFPGCREVALRARMHQIPDLEQCPRDPSNRPTRRIDLESEEFYSVPERIGEYPCAD